MVAKAKATIEFEAIQEACKDGNLSRRIGFGYAVDLDRIAVGSDKPLIRLVWARIWGPR